MGNRVIWAQFEWLPISAIRHSLNWHSLRTLIADTHCGHSLRYNFPKNEHRPEHTASNCSTGRQRGVRHLNLRPPHRTFWICNVKSHYLNSLGTRPVTIPFNFNHAKRTMLTAITPHSGCSTPGIDWELWQAVWPLPTAASPLLIIWHSQRRWVCF